MGLLRLVPFKFFHQAQEEAYDTLISANGGIVWHKAGEGKTRVGLAAGLRIAHTDHRPIILFVGRRIAFLDVYQEFANLQLKNDANIQELESLSKARQFKRPTFLLMSWGMWNNVYQFDLINQLISQIGCMVLDEGWLYKNPRANVHEQAARIGKLVPTILMSGSIMPAKDITDIYGQTSVIGRGGTLAPTLSKFRSKFMLGISGDYLSWYPKKGAYKEIIAAVSPFTHIHFPPDSERQIRTAVKKIEATEQQCGYFKELKEYAGIEGKFEINQQGALIIKAQQISDGWLKRDDGEIETFPSNKVKATIHHLEEIFNGGERRVVIWCAFRYDITRLADELEPHFKGIEILKLSGSHTFREDRWKACKFAITLATMSSGTSFNYFGQVPYAIYFSQDWKWLSLDQSQRRHLRKDSKHDAAHFTFLHTEGSLDDKVYYTVKSAASTERTFIRQLDVAQWIKT